LDAPGAEDFDRARIEADGALARDGLRVVGVVIVIGAGLPAS
jgi:hypothetical protein